MYNLVKRVANCTNCAVNVIGNSYLGRNVYAFGEGNRVLLVGGIHAREHITAFLLTLLAARGQLYKDFCIIPLLNPDGTQLSIRGISSAPTGNRAYLTRLNGSEDFSLWKANGRGVDLNVNWDADWGTGKQNVFTPAPANYVGQEPLSEAENKAVFNLINRKKPQIALFFHSKGEVIYWGYGNTFPHPRYAKELSDALGYPLTASTGSAGGMKDWLTINTAAFSATIEMGRDNLSYMEQYTDTFALWNKIKVLVNFLTSTYSTF